MLCRGLVDTGAGNTVNFWTKFRGNTFLGFCTNAGSITFTAPLFIGNNIAPISPEQYAIKNDVNYPPYDPFIWAFNKFMNGNGISYAVNYGIGTNIFIGALVAQNVIETSVSGAGVPLDVMNCGHDFEY
jgi:hypothetical protein